MYKSFVGAAEETRRKLDALKLKNVYGKVLDTCTGLGYTAIAASRGIGVTEVVTCEIDQATIELCRFNPWSRALFRDEDPSAPIEKFNKYQTNTSFSPIQEEDNNKKNNKRKENPDSPHNQHLRRSSHNIQLIQGDVSEYILELSSDSFAGIIHDPPPLSNSKVAPLYSTFFYEELYRVMKPRGRLFHYVGYTKSYDSSKKYKEVLSKLKKVGFSKVMVVPHAFGVVAVKEDAKTIGKRRRLQEELNLYMDDSGLFDDFITENFDTISDKKEGDNSESAGDNDNENQNGSSSIRNSKVGKLLWKFQDERNTVYISDRKKMKTRKKGKIKEFGNLNLEYKKDQLFKKNSIVEEIVEKLNTNQVDGGEKSIESAKAMKLYSKNDISVTDYPGSYSTLGSSSGSGSGTSFANQKFRKVSMSKYQKLPNSPFNTSSVKGVNDYQMNNKSLIEKMKQSRPNGVEGEKDDHRGKNALYSPMKFQAVEDHHNKYGNILATDEELRGILGLDEEEGDENFEKPLKQDKGEQDSERNN